MSQQLLLQQLGGQLGVSSTAGFMLVLARVSPLFAVAPLFSSNSVPRRIRGIVAVALALGLTPLALAGQTVPTAPLALGGLIVKELLVGLAFALTVSLMFAAVQSAGTFLDTIVGFSFGGLVDPLTGNQATILSQVYALFGVLVFIAIGGDAWLIQGLARTFDLVPITGTPSIATLGSGVVGAFGSIFASALEVAAPVLLAAVITDSAFGIVSRVVPQLNVFAVGFPVKIVVGLLIVGASLPFVSGWISDQLQQSVAQALQIVKVA